MNKRLLLDKIKKILSETVDAGYDASFINRVTKECLENIKTSNPFMVDGDRHFYKNPKSDKNIIIVNKNGDSYHSLSVFNDEGTHLVHSLGNKMSHPNSTEIFNNIHSISKIYKKPVLSDGFQNKGSIQFWDNILINHPHNSKMVDLKDGNIVDANSDNRQGRNLLNRRYYYNV